MVPREGPPAEVAQTWARATEWTLRKFTGLPAGGWKAALAWISAALILIGWLDYVTGTRISLVIAYLVPVALAVAWLGFTAGWLTAIGGVAIRFGADMADDPAALRQTWLWWNSLGSLVVYLTVVWILDALVRLHRQLGQRVRERTEELQREVRKRRQVQRELLDLSASERSAMGRELHDQLGQHLVGTAMAAQVLAHRLQVRDEQAAREARKVVDLVEQGIAQTRQLAHGLLLARIEPERLKSEFQELCAALRQQFPQVDGDCRVEVPRHLRDPAVAAQIYRIAQEALRNACRHSGASRVTLAVREEGEVLLLEVEDNGSGLAPAGERSAGLGLRIMQHRAEHLGAKLIISAQPGRGTRVTCVVPLERISR